MTDDYFDRIERQLSQRAEQRGRRRRPRLTVPSLRREWLAPAMAVAVVIVVIAVFLGVHSSSIPHAARPTQRGQTLNAFPRHGTSFTFRPAGGHASAAELSATSELLASRLHAAFPGVKSVVSVDDNGDLTADVGAKGAGVATLVSILAGPGHLAFYDWEANVLLPSGRTVASGLQAQRPAALAISQGEMTGGAADGALTRSAATALAARYEHAHHRPAVVLEAVAPSLAETPSTSSPAARFFVLRDRPTLNTEGTVRHAAAGTDQAGQPDVQIVLSAAGNRAFSTLTEAVAHRGALVSGLGQKYIQHFAVALDGHLLTVPSVDYTEYPDGVQGTTGTEIDGGFNRSEARALAAMIGVKPLSIVLNQVK